MNLVVYLMPFKRLLSRAHVTPYATKICHSELVLASADISQNPKTPKRLQSDRSALKLAAFSLVEMLMALLVASLLLAALAPVMTKRMNESVTVTGGGEGAPPAPKVKKHEIEYGSTECATIRTDADGSEYCEGVFVVPTGFNGRMKVTLIGAGGGGATAPNAGYTEYASAGDRSFTVPYGTEELEVTLVEGGGGGGAGYIDPNIKGYAWTHSGSLNRSYVSTSDVSSNVSNVKVSGDSVSSSYAHGTATLSSSALQYAAQKKIFITMAGGGGGGGRGHGGTGGGGGAAYKRTMKTITSGQSYTVSVGAGGASHACEGSGGCGGAASSITGLLTAGGGGGGGWLMPDGVHATAGESGGAKPIISGSCVYPNVTISLMWGGKGASPSGGDGLGMQWCGNGEGVTHICARGSNGGTSPFGTNGVYSYTSSSARHGQGYGAGGCGSGAEGCSTYPTTNAGPDFTGNGAPGFVAAEWYNTANGGAGGGSGSMLPLHKVKVSQNEALTVTVGRGGSGGIAGSVSTIGSYTAGGNGENGWPSYLKRGSAYLLKTSFNSPPTLCNCGACGGDNSGRCEGVWCAAGWVHQYVASSDGFDRSGYSWNSTQGIMTNSKFPGFRTMIGKASGNRVAPGYTGTLTTSDKGGNGGQTVIFGGQPCAVGVGSTTLGVAGGSATGSGGCGGGGGYGIANGGNGASGYARISWNKYWNSTRNDYDYVLRGAGGAGASGNILKYDRLDVRSGEVIKIRIGKGGNGGSISNNALVEAQNGGNTIFAYGTAKQLSAGGGKRGSFPTIVPIVSGVDNGGAGGEISTLCKFGSTNYFNDAYYCTKGEKGGKSVNNKGGKGGNLTTYGIGGDGGSLGSSSNGNNASGLGAGGGGAGIREIGTASISTYNPNEGGRGTNGKIMLEWLE